MSVPLLPSFHLISYIDEHRNTKEAQASPPVFCNNVCSQWERGLIFRWRPVQQLLTVDAILVACNLSQCSQLWNPSLYILFEGPHKTLLLNQLIAQGLFLPMKGTPTLYDVSLRLFGRQVTRWPLVTNKSTNQQM